KAVDGGRLTPEEGLSLFACRDLAALGRAADAVCRRLHPEPYRTYNIDRNINYSNVCAAVCDFCAFYRKSGDPDAYVLPREVLYQKVEETIALGGDQVLLQGGNHPTLRLEWYEELLRDLRARYPAVNLHAFSAAEVWHFHKLNKLPLREVLARLKDAGLGSLPGGGAEILSDRVRKAITVNKVLTEEWLEVHRTWHELGGRSTCTMMFGHVETPAERVEHLERLRRLQDQTGGFTAFICWTFQPGNTALGGREVGSVEYLRTLAFARLFLDNVPHVKTHWPMVTPFISQVALIFGCDDLEGTVVFERVYHEAGAGTPMWLSYDQIVGLIRGAGKEPAERDSLYHTVRTFEDWVPETPGLSPGVRPQGPDGPMFSISHRLRARARGDRSLPVLSAVEAAE
ncbi:MAG TPA: cyclic dehypoxanthinyl futalosine synthase, partial [Candidatus Binatia bacterium]|nr:cyclic dehypoxanthinyl futalosine synthase [Candidatus Binatia bacterium]